MMEDKEKSKESLRPDFDFLGNRIQDSTPGAKPVGLSAKEAADKRAAAARRYFQSVGGTRRFLALWYPNEVSDRPERREQPEKARPSRWPVLRATLPQHQTA